MDITRWRAGFDQSNLTSEGAIRESDIVIATKPPSCDQSVTSSLQSDFLMFYLHHRKIPSGHLFLAMQFVSEFI